MMRASEFEINQLLDAISANCDVPHVVFTKQAILWGDDLPIDVTDDEYFASLRLKLKNCLASDDRPAAIAHCLELGLPVEICVKMLSVCRRLNKRNWVSDLAVAAVWRVPTYCLSAGETDLQFPFDTQGLRAAFYCGDEGRIPDTLRSKLLISRAAPAGFVAQSNTSWHREIF